MAGLGIDGRFQELWDHFGLGDKQATAVEERVTALEAGLTDVGKLVADDVAALRKDFEALKSDAEGALVRLEAAKTEADAYLSKRISAVKADYNAFSVYAESMLDNRITVVREALKELAVRPVETAITDIKAEAEAVAVETVAKVSLGRALGAPFRAFGRGVDATLVWFRTP